MDSSPTKGLDNQVHSRGILRGTPFVGMVSEVKDVGTAYGKEASFNTAETTFTRASDSPAQTIVLCYATKERLKTWGVPADEPAQGPTTANPFPASTGVPAPAGWKG